MTTTPEGGGELRGVPAIGTDPDELEVFYREHLAFVRLYLARRVDDPFVVADLTADVFLAAIRSAHRYRRDLGPPRAWLIGIARHVVADRRRLSAREHAAVRRLNARELLDEDSTERIVERIAASTDARVMLARIAELPDSLRNVVELVAVDELSIVEAAAVLGISSGAARVRYHRARRLLHLLRPPRPRGDPMNHATTRLDSFESALLVQLRATVDPAAATSPLSPPPVTAARPPSRAGRRWYVPTAAAAAAALAVALGVHAVWPTPAYAVSGRNGGKVTVRVMRLEGAEELERELGKRGIPADVTYLPYGKECAPGRYTAVRTPGLMLAVSADRFEVTIPPRAVGKGDTFVLFAAVKPIQDGFTSSVEFDVAQGAVASCRVVDAS